MRWRWPKPGRWRWHRSKGWRRNCRGISPGTRPAPTCWPAWAAPMPPVTGPSAMLQMQTTPHFWPEGATGCPETGIWCFAKKKAELSLGRSPTGRYEGCKRNSITAFESGFRGRGLVVQALSCRGRGNADMRCAHGYAGNFQIIDENAYFAAPQYCAVAEKSLARVAPMHNDFVHHKVTEGADAFGVPQLLGVGQKHRHLV